jgi:hypothetical protein
MNESSASGVQIGFGSARGRRDDEPSLERKIALRKSRIKLDCALSEHYLLMRPFENNRVPSVINP